MGVGTRERRGAQPPAKDVLLLTLNEAYRGPAWHGPAVLTSLRGVSPDIAVIRPGPGRNSIWDLVLHLAYTRHISLARLGAAMKSTTPRFPRKMRASWFPELPEDHGAKVWKADLALLADCQDRLIEAIGKAPDPALARKRRGKSRSIGAELLGVALHDAYHAGQIRLLAKTLPR